MRPAHAKNPLFGGKALKLLTVGRGYGKRFTFDDDCRNDNQHYFWSDSYLEGFGFAPHEIFAGQKFRICAGAGMSEELGIAIVEKANQPQVSFAKNFNVKFNGKFNGKFNSKFNGKFNQNLVSLQTGGD